MTFHGYSSLLLMCFLMMAIKVSIATEKYAGVDASEDDKHENRPRLLGGFFSRPKPDAQKQQGGFKDHLGNVFGGGSIGFQAEFQPLAPIHDLINHAKNFLPKPVMPSFDKPIFKPQDGKEPRPWWQGDGKGESGGKPENEEYDESHSDGKPKPEEYDETYSDGKPKPEEYDETDSDGKPKPEEYDETDSDGKPKPGEYDETYPEVKPEEYEEPKDWEHKDPTDANTNGPRWEDIGEDGYEDATTVPIEEIIQPRIRPRRTKRRIESKVFHVPIEFVSNAKPYLVKFGSKNEIGI